MNKKIFFSLTLLIVLFNGCGSGGENSKTSSSSSTNDDTTKSSTTIAKSTIKSNSTAITLPNLPGTSSVPTDSLNTN